MKTLKIKMKNFVSGRKGDDIHSGFTLIEVIIYLAIFSMIVTVLIPLSYSSAIENRTTADDVINAYENNF